MKYIIKILEYLSERDAVVMRACRLNSHKSIDEYPEKVFDCDSLNKLDTEHFIHSLIDRAESLINEQDEDQGVLSENVPIKPTGELDFEEIVGKVFQANTTWRRTRTLKMRRVEL